MKTMKLLALATVVLMTALSCQKGETSATSEVTTDKNSSESTTDKTTFEVTTDKTAITVTADKADTLAYTATGFTGTVSAALDATVADVTIKNTFDTGSGKGTVVFTTKNQNRKEYSSATLTFKDSQKEIVKTISIKIKDTWSVEPAEPEEGGKEGIM